MNPSAGTVQATVDRVAQEIVAAAKKAGMTRTKALLALHAAYTALYKLAQARGKQHEPKLR
jgi:hypothetical protein